MRISATMLGRLALSDACERCFWLGYHMGDKLPFQRPFPGIFASIDSYTKRAIETQFRSMGGTPSYLSELGSLDKPIKPPNHHQFSYTDPELGVTLRGVPDMMFLRRDGTMVIGDYKTARLTDAQKNLLPAYAVQLNTYALIASRLSYPPVSLLALLYCEPETEDHHLEEPNNHLPYGFRLGFRCTVVKVAIDPQQVYQLAHRAKQIVLSPDPPPSREGCESCQQFEQLLRLLKIR